MKYVFRFSLQLLPETYLSVRSMYTAYTVGTIIKNVMVFIFNPDDICPNHEF